MDLKSTRRFTDKTSRLVAAGLLVTIARKPTLHPHSKFQLEILTRKSNSKSNWKNQFEILVAWKSNSKIQLKIQLENPTRNPNSEASLSRWFARPKRKCTIFGHLGGWQLKWRFSNFPLFNFEKTKALQGLWLVHYRWYLGKMWRNPKFHSVSFSIFREIGSFDQPSQTGLLCFPETHGWFSPLNMWN